MPLDILSLIPFFSYLFIAKITAISSANSLGLSRGLRIATPYSMGPLADTIVAIIML